MTASQWKIIGQLKEQITDNYMMSFAKREWTNLIKRLPATTKHAIQSKDISTEPSATDKNSRVGQTFLDSLQVVSDLRARLQTSVVVAKTTMADSKWKNKPKSISPESIVSRTNYLISALESAHSDESVVKRLDDLLAHFLEYPDATGLAVKYGAIKVLLKIRLNTKSEAAREGAQGLLGMYI